MCRAQEDGYTHATPLREREFLLMNFSPEGVDDPHAAWQHSTITNSREFFREK